MHAREALSFITVPATMRAAVELWRAGENTADIADILGLPEATVANSLARHHEINRRMAA